MLSTGNSIKQITPFSVATVHVRTGCGAKETKQIRRLSESSIPIREWISYVEPEHINADHIQGPTRNIVRPYNPLCGVNFDCTARGSHFILAGSLKWLPRIFKEVCGINFWRFEDMEFHSSLDMLGFETMRSLTDEDKKTILTDHSNQFCKVLDLFQAERDAGARVYFDGGEPLIRIFGKPKRPTTLLYWHSTLEKMMGHILGAENA